MCDQLDNLHYSFTNIVRNILVLLCRQMREKAPRKGCSRGTKKYKCHYIQEELISAHLCQLDLWTEEITDALSLWHLATSKNE